MFHLDRSQLKALLSAIPDTHNRLMVLVAFNHGLRVSEVINLTGADIRDGHIKVQRLKGSMKTIQPYVKHPDPDLNESEGLETLAVATRSNGKVFPMTRFGADKLMRRAGAKAGLPAHLCHFHILKHSVAAQSIQKAGVEHVRQWLGHKSIASTGAYLRVTDQAAAVAILAAL